MTRACTRTTLTHILIKQRSYSPLVAAQHSWLARHLCWRRNQIAGLLNSRVGRSSDPALPYVAVVRHIYLTAAASLGDGGAVERPPQQRQLRAYVSALLLAYFASQRGSLYAAQCVVETCLRAYCQGCTYDDLQLELSAMALERVGTLLSPPEQDELLSWVALVMATLEDMEVPRDGDDGISDGDGVSGTDDVNDDDDIVDVLMRQQREGQRGVQGRQGSEEGAVPAAAAAGGGGSGDVGGGMQRHDVGAGLRGFVHMVLAQYLGGLTLARLQLTQSVANVGEEGAAMSPAVRVMQQNTRLIVLTLELLREEGVETRCPLEPAAALAEEDAGEVVVIDYDDSGEEDTQRQQERPAAASGDGRVQGEAGGATEAKPQQQQQCKEEEEEGIQGSGAQEGEEKEGMQQQLGVSIRASEYIDSFLADDNDDNGDISGESSPARAGTVATSSSGSGDACAAAARRLRGDAVRLLVCFMGAALRSQYSASALVEHCYGAYRRGWSASDLVSQLREVDFQQTGGLMPSEGLGGPHVIGRELFSRWLSICYMTFAQLGVPRPPASPISAAAALKDASKQQQGPGQRAGEEQVGWAWAGRSLVDGSDSSATEAAYLAAFVADVLRRGGSGSGGGGGLDQVSSAEQQQDQQQQQRQRQLEEGGTLPGSGAAASGPATDNDDDVVAEGAAMDDDDVVAEGARHRGAFAASGQWEGFSLVRIEDGGLAASSPSNALLAQQMSLVEMAAQHAEQQRQRHASVQAARKGGGGGGGGGAA